jgi:hypothetical protein
LLSEDQLWWEVLQNLVPLGSKPLLSQTCVADATFCQTLVKLSGLLGFELLQGRLQKVKV